MHAIRSSPKHALQAMAAEQSGYFTAAQALELGYGYPQQSYHADRGNWVRIERGLYRLPHWPIGPHDDLIRACLWSREKGVVSHESAAAVHAYGEIDPLRTHLTVSRRFRGRHPALILHRGELQDDEIEQHAGFRVTTPLRTLVDLSTSATDLDQFGEALRTALDSRRVKLADLRERAEQVDPLAALRIEHALQALAATAESS